jgi:hypothetical protein
MKLFDTLYYAIYRFGRSIGQPRLQAKACAGNFMPMFFMMAAFCLNVVVGYKWYPSILPPKNFRPTFIALVIAVLAASYMVYGGGKGRGERIISAYEKSKSQNFYVWLGAIFSIVSVSSPVWIYFVWRATLK